MERIAWLVAAGGIIALAVFDWKTRRVPAPFLWLYLLTGAVFGLLRLGIAGALVSLLPGLLLLLLFFVTRGQVGPGDGICYLALGLLLGSASCFLVLVLSLVFSSACGGILLALKKVTRGTRLPFLVFTACGLGAAALLKLGGVR